MPHCARAVGWNPYLTPAQNLVNYLYGSLKIKYDKDIADLLIKYMDYICEIEVEQGIIKKVSPIKQFKEFETELKEELTEEAEPLSTLKQQVIKSMSEIKQTSEIVKEDELYIVLKKEYGIERDIAVRIIGLLLRNGIIYSPRPGYFKKVDD